MSKAVPKGGLVDLEREVRHTKEDALSDREFELLVEGTYRMDDDYFALESRLVVFLAGRYGMRAGEIAHMREDWIDWERGMITIPRHQPCEKGRDGKKCGYCRQAAEQMADHNPGLDFETALKYLWSPKTENSAREIPIDATARARIALQRYFERFDRFQASRGVVNRRVTWAAEEAEEIDADELYPHALRATAASYYVSRGIDIIALKAMFGWECLSTAQHYLQDSGERTARSLRRLSR
ncbi:tyrosine-type recombinase/integrase [Haloferax volcanii]|uniref:tyrosine-type recombinase/integrase n=1 Tax=Haloferax volcanii TaxID=2246 RepID=UPI002499B950|nr:tyrosine-type recombinase/integrase [Haloferax alexandrinus]WEL29839.1 Site-specific integrase [Haloferax alexandrinus]